MIRTTTMMTGWSSTMESGREEAGSYLDGLFEGHPSLLWWWETPWLMFPGVLLLSSWHVLRQVHHILSWGVPWGNLLFAMNWMPMMRCLILRKKNQLSNSFILRSKWQSIKSIRDNVSILMPVFTISGSLSHEKRFFPYWLNKLWMALNVFSNLRTLL